MAAYIARRLLLMIPTLFGIMLITFAIAQVMPGGPVERIIAQLSGANTDATARIGGGGAADASAIQSQAGTGTSYRGAQGLDPEFIKQLEKQFGFDKPVHERFLKMLTDYARFDFGESFFKGATVLQLIKDKLPVSITLGLWMTLLSYAISIPLGIRKAVHDGSRFDTWTSAIVIVGYAIPAFLFAVLLITVFAGGSFYQIFPLRGLSTTSWVELPGFLKALYPESVVGSTARPADFLPWYWRIFDYFWHVTLPLLAMVLGAFATSTLLTKNSFLDEIRKQYVMTARMKGLTENRVLYGHVFRNAMLIVISGFPAAFVHAFFAGSLLIETIFSLDGLGLLSFDATLNRDYPVVFANIFIFSLIGLVVSLLSDLTYMWIDPRIDFEARDI
jgi:microcin C transport system permease protein